VKNVLKEGDMSPDFSLKDQEGNTHRLSEYKGKKVVLYFYPKDMTPGCTTEACRFRDDMAEFSNRGIVVLGVSNDDVSSHKRFADKNKLNFPLLSDTNKEVVQKYGVYKEKSFLGKKFMGINRTTFVIDDKGVIRKVYFKVDVKEHSKEILKFINKI
jgi:peroxiredoxin Q/BCP